MSNILEGFDDTVYQRITSKVADYSIAKTDVGDTFNDLAQLALLIPQSNVDLTYPKDWLTRDADYKLYISLLDNVNGDTTISQNWQLISGGGGIGSIYALTAQEFNDEYTSLNPSIEEYKDNALYIISPQSNNTGAATYEINALGALPIQKLLNGVLSDLEADDLSSNGQYILLWRTSYFYLVASDIPTLQKVTDAGNTTSNNIEFDSGAGVYFDNGSSVVEGTTDAGLGGNKGVALRCSIFYELKWEAGRLFVMEQDGFTIRATLYNFNVTPTTSDDDTKGYIIGSRWILDNGYVYTCTDATTNNAVWALTTTGLTSVGLTMPSAFSVSGSPVINSGTLAVTAAGAANQYIKGDGTLAVFPSISGGGASVSYYLNGSVNQGTFGGSTYYELSKTAITGVGTNFSTSSNGLIAQFITDANDPAQLLIPSGNWNFELYFNASSSGGSPSFYVELLKYDGANFTLIASNQSAPEGITNGTTLDSYFTPLAVPETVLLATDRLAIRVYVNTSGRTITLHTEDNNLCQIITTFSTGLTALNSLTKQVQYLTVGTSGTDFAISSVTDTHTFNLPTASATNRGALSSADWSTFNSKEPAITTLPINKGGTNSGTSLSNNRVMQSSGGAIVEASAITGSRALKSDANGIPTHFDTDTEPSLTELSYVKGVTSAIQTQINNKVTNYYLPFFVGFSGSTSPADGLIYYFSQLQGAAASQTATNMPIKFFLAGTLESFIFVIGQTANGSNETVTVALRNITTSTDTTLGTFTSDFGAVRTNISFTGLSIAINTTDTYTIKITCPTWATNPQGWQISGNLNIKI